MKSFDFRKASPRVLREAVNFEIYVAERSPISLRGCRAFIFRIEKQYSPGDRTLSPSKAWGVVWLRTPCVRAPEIPCRSNFIVVLGCMCYQTSWKGAAADVDRRRSSHPACTPVHHL